RLPRTASGSASSDLPLRPFEEGVHREGGGLLLEPRAERLRVAQGEAKRDVRISGGGVASLHVNADDRIPGDVVLTVDVVRQGEAGADPVVDPLELGHPGEPYRPIKEKERPCRSCRPSPRSQDASPRRASYSAITARAASAVPPWSGCPSLMRRRYAA